VPAGEAVQFHQHGAADAVGVGRGEGAADHSAPRVADEVGPILAERVEDVDDAAGAVGEIERRRELLALPVTRRVDHDDAVTIAEVVSLGGPHVAGHQQAGPEHQRVAATADLYP
jgi:hypothetical protein